MYLFVNMTSIILILRLIKFKIYNFKIFIEENFTPEHSYISVSAFFNIPCNTLRIFIDLILVNFTTFFKLFLVNILPTFLLF